jgi:hypothetical protein
MAITRAQQAKQMLREGGRIGFFLGGNFNPSSTTSAQKSASKGSTTSYNAPSRVATNPQQDYSDEANQRGAYAPGATQAYEVIGGQKRAVITGGPNAARNEEERRILKKIEEDKRQKEIEEFINKPPKPINTPFPIVTAGLNTAQKFLPYKVTRRFYAGDVVGRTVTLPDGRTITFDLDNYDEYDQLRKEGIINAYGRPLTDAERSRFDDDSNDNQILFPEDMEDNTGNGSDDDDDTNTGGLALRFRKDGGRINAMDGGMMSPEGGIMDLETGRQMYFLGKLVKKATRAVKKITKSPLGKAALGAALFKFGPGLLAKDSAFAKFMLTDPSKGFSLSNLFGKGLTGKGAMAGIAALSAAPLLFGQEEEDEEEEFYRGPSLDIAGIRNNPYDFRARRFAVEGGIMRTGYQEGSKEPVAKKTMPLLDMGGKEMDLRDDGGFVPLGRMERADDVPARLSKNEFVFTADAVRNAGEGDVDKGAEVMYNMMKNLESGGEVSEESQGLSGAREMFQTSKRLEEVL